MSHTEKTKQPSCVVLPEPFEMRPFQTVDQGSTNYKAGFNAALRKVRESLNSPSDPGTVQVPIELVGRITKTCYPKESDVSDLRALLAQHEGAKS